MENFIQEQSSNDAKIIMDLVSVFGLGMIALRLKDGETPVMQVLKDQNGEVRFYGGRFYESVFFTDAKDVNRSIKIDIVSDDVQLFVSENGSHGPYKELSLSDAAMTDWYQAFLDCAKRRIAEENSQK